MNGCSFQHVLQQIWVRFCLKHWKTLFLRDFILKPTERADVLLKMVIEVFEILNAFNALTLRQISWKRKTFFKKVEYGFLVDSIKD